MSDEMPRPDRRFLLASMALLAGAGALPARGEQAPQGAAMKHVVLLGDSIFDNQAYVGAGPDVIEQLREALPASSSATLAAVDGSVTADIKSQLKTIPKNATHLIVSAGGNDALHEKGLIEESARSVAEVLDKLADVREAFQASYAAMLDAVVARKLPTAVCTIYEARYQDRTTRKIAGAGLAVFNDTILREAFKRALPVIDLRLMFDDDADYANDIEPSVKGGAKIARAIVTLVETHDFTRRRTEIYV
ncbi:MAG TPA: SGNH/GDSL hydrolase family protein [Methyloceanibacter sp.]|nr:SGNH/GDSL hydrolase family protein [Methyloceanibacter sp.]